VSIVNIREALPLEHAPYMNECPPAIQRGLTDSLASTLELGRCFGAQCASLDLGLDRVEGAVGLLNRAEILSEALAISEEGPVLCMQVRVPRRFPRSWEWQFARDLLAQCGSPRVGVAVNVVIDDISPQPSPEDLRKLFGERLRLVRFLLHEAGPAGFAVGTVRAWAKALAGWSNPPAVVFSAPLRQGRSPRSFLQGAADAARGLFGA
jgi:hypothetical protein